MDKPRKFRENIKKGITLNYKEENRLDQMIINNLGIEFGLNNYPSTNQAMTTKNSLNKSMFGPISEQDDQGFLKVPQRETQ